MSIVVKMYQQNGSHNLPDVRKFEFYSGVQLSGFFLVVFNSAHTHSTFFVTGIRIINQAEPRSYVFSYRVH